MNKIRCLQQWFSIAVSKSIMNYRAVFIFIAFIPSIIFAQVDMFDQKIKQLFFN